MRLVLHALVASALSLASAHVCAANASGGASNLGEDASALRLVLLGLVGLAAAHRKGDPSL